MTNFQIMVWCLQAFAAVIAVVAGLMTIAKHFKGFRPQTRSKVSNWIVVAIPLLLSAVAIVAMILQAPLTASAVFVAALLAEIIIFSRDPNPLSRAGVVNFVASCCAYTGSAVATVLGALIVRTVEAVALLNGNFKELLEVVKLLSQRAP